MRLSRIAKNWNKIKQTTYVKGGGNSNNFIRFDIGEPWFSLSPEIDKFIKRLKVEDFKSRPDNHCEKLKKSAASFWKIPVKNIAVSNGSDQFIWLLPKLFMDSRDKTLVIDPTFFLFSESVERMGGEVISVSTSPDNGFEISNEIISKIIQLSNENLVKIIWLCNPNNPTGITIPLGTIKRIASYTKALVVVDEAFFDISELPSSESSIRLIKEHKNIIVLKTLSKTFGLNSIRVGFAFAQKDIIDVLNDWRLPFEVSSMAQEIGSIILNDKKSWNRMKIGILDEKKWLTDEIRKLRNIELGSSTKTTILLFRDKNTDLFKALLKRGILTADFNKCKGIKNMGFVRASVLDRKSNEILLRILKSYQSFE